METYDRSNREDALKKCLIISYYWPPCGGASVQRWTRFVKYLPLFGWKPTVITTLDGDYPFIDKSLEQTIPVDIQVIKTKTFTYSGIYRKVLGKDEALPYGNTSTNKKDSILKRLLFWLRLNFVVPDMRILWNPNAYKAAEKALMKGAYEVVITTGPPHSSHLIGKRLKEKYGIKWIADFRDPWTKIFYLDNAVTNPIARMCNRYYERSVVETADLNIVVSQFISEQLPASTKVVITNGFNPADFEGQNYQRTESFRVKYVGKVTQGQRIDLFFKSYSQLIKTQSISDMEFSFIGTDNCKHIRETYPECKIRETGFLSHRDALAETVHSEVLLLLINQYPGSEGMLTTKLFEYIGSRTFIIGIGPTNGNAAKILAQYNAGVMVDYDQYQSIASVIQQQYEIWKTKHFEKNTTCLDPITTQYQAMTLASYLEQITKE